MSIEDGYLDIQEWISQYEAEEAEDEEAYNLTQN